MMIPWDKLFDKYAAIRDDVLRLWRAGCLEEAIERGERWWQELLDLEGSLERQSALLIAAHAARAGDTTQERVWLARARKAGPAQIRVEPDDPMDDPVGIRTVLGLVVSRRSVWLGSSPIVGSFSAASAAAALT